jgi:hypothetical protein
MAIHDSSESVRMMCHLYRVFHGYALSNIKLFARAVKTNKTNSVDFSPQASYTD